MPVTTKPHCSHAALPWRGIRRKPRGISTRQTCSSWRRWSSDPASLASPPRYRYLQLHPSQATGIGTSPISLARAGCARRLGHRRSRTALQCTPSSRTQRSHTRRDCRFPLSAHCAALAGRGTVRRRSVHAGVTGQDDRQQRPADRCARARSRRHAGNEQPRPLRAHRRPALRKLGLRGQKEPGSDPGSLSVRSPHPRRTDCSRARLRNSTSAHAPARRRRRRRAATASP